MRTWERRNAQHFAIAATLTCTQMTAQFSWMLRHPTIAIFEVDFSRIVFRCHLFFWLITDKSATRQRVFWYKAYVSIIQFALLKIISSINQGKILFVNRNLLCYFHQLEAACMLRVIDICDWCVIDVHYHTFK